MSDTPSAQRLREALAAVKADTNLPRPVHVFRVASDGMLVGMASVVTWDRLEVEVNAIKRHGGIVRCRIVGTDMTGRTVNEIAKRFARLRIEGRA